MKNAQKARLKIRTCMGIGLIILMGSQAVSVGAQERNEKLRSFEADRQDCLSGKSGQALAPCMKEAKAAFAQRPNATPAVSPEQLQRNSVMRCESLTGDERTACKERMHGEGTVSGSIAGGGLLRELTTTNSAPHSAQKSP
jgi:hypothetical protein